MNEQAAEQRVEGRQCPGGSKGALCVLGPDLGSRYQMIGWGVAMTSICRLSLAYVVQVRELCSFLGLVCPGSSEGMFPRCDFNTPMFPYSLNSPHQCMEQLLFILQGTSRLPFWVAWVVYRSTQGLFPFTSIKIESKVVCEMESPRIRHSLRKHCSPNYNVTPRRPQTLSQKH